MLWNKRIGIMGGWGVVWGGGGGWSPVAGEHVSAAGSGLWGRRERAQKWVRAVRGCIVCDCTGQSNSIKGHAIIMRPFLSANYELRVALSRRWLCCRWQRNSAVLPLWFTWNQLTCHNHDDRQTICINRNQNNPVSTPICTHLHSR